MEVFVQSLTDAIKPPWNYLLAIVALLLVVGPQLASLRRDVVDIRGGRRRLDLEKARLEVLKLRLEVERLKKENPLPDLDEVLPPLLQPVAKSDAGPQEDVEARVPKWLMNRPRFGKVLLLVTQGILAYTMVSCAIVTVVTPVTGWNDSSFGPGLSIIAALVYALITWVTYRYFVKVRRLRRLLKDAS